MGQVWNWRKSLPTIWRPCSNSTINTEGADVKKYHVTVDEDGCISWYKDAEFTVLHRDGAPAFEHVDGGKEWWLNGNIHRTDGPAVECASGAKFWWLNGQLHRVDGPAIEYASGTKEWWLNGEEVTYEEHAHRVNPAQEMTVAEIEKLLGHRVKIVK